VSARNLLRAEGVRFNRAGKAGGNPLHAIATAAGRGGWQQRRGAAAAAVATSITPPPALLQKGSLQRRARQKRAAQRTLEEALAIFERVQAGPWIARTRDELSRIGLRRAARTEQLTHAQARIAELVLDGMTNREIAASLYMSQRSVESHLTALYRRFGVRSRSQLVAGLGHGDRQPVDERNRPGLAAPFRRPRRGPPARCRPGLRAPL
jgi:DNA-binding CsgD family transcriptional regulator